MNKKYEIYGYAVESLNKCIGPRTGEYLGEEWTRYNKKIYDTKESARKAWEENSYKYSKNGYMADYKIIILYQLKFNEKIKKLSKPKPPLGRLILEGAIRWTGECPFCDSSTIKKYWWFGPIIGCIHPECKNYYKK